MTNKKIEYDRPLEGNTFQGGLDLACHPGIAFNICLALVFHPMLDVLLKQWQTFGRRITFYGSLVLPCHPGIVFSIGLTLVCHPKLDDLWKKMNKEYGSLELVCHPKIAFSIGLILVYYTMLDAQSVKMTITKRQDNLLWQPRPCMPPCTTILYMPHFCMPPYVKWSIMAV